MARGRFSAKASTSETRASLLSDMDQASSLKAAMFAIRTYCRVGKAYRPSGPRFLIQIKCSWGHCDETGPQGQWCFVRCGKAMKPAAPEGWPPHGLQYLLACSRRECSRAGVALGPSRCRCAPLRQLKGAGEPSGRSSHSLFTRSRATGARRMYVPDGLQQFFVVRSSTKPGEFGNQRAWAIAR